MNLQYFHGQKHKGCHKEFTIVVDVPSKEKLVSDINDLVMGRSTSISIPYGYTEVLGSDQYCKAIGRNFALSRCSSKHMNVIMTTKNNTTKVCFLDKNISFTLELKAERNKVHFISGNVYTDENSLFIY